MKQTETIGWLIKKVETYRSVLNGKVKLDVPISMTMEKDVTVTASRISNRLGQGFSNFRLQILRHITAGKL